MEIYPLFPFQKVIFDKTICRWHRFTHLCDPSLNFSAATFVCAKFLLISVIFLVGDEIGLLADVGLEIAGIAQVTF